MPSVATEAIVLRTYRLAEADKIVVLMTQEAGLVRGVARGARRVKSRFGASLEPWTLCHLTYFEKEGRELVTLSSVEIVRSSFNLSQHTELVHALEYMSELTLEFMPPHEANPNMFRMLKATAQAAQREQVHVRRLVQYFELWTLRLSGYLPSFKRCMTCRQPLKSDHQAFVTLEGAIRCARCAAGVEIPLTARAVSRVQLMERISPEDFACKDSLQLRDDVEEEREIRQLTERLITRVLEREPRGRLARSSAESSLRN